MTEERQKRGLPARFVIAVTVGGTIGLGILRFPGEVADLVPNPLLYLALWLFGGAFVALTTVVVAELIGITPRSGGIYPLVRRAYGPYAGFVIGWADWLTYVADLAFKAIVVMEFIAILLPETTPWQKPLAILVTTFFAALQLRGVGLTALVQEYATSLIGLVIVGLALVLLFSGGPPETPEMTPVKNSLNDWSLLIAAMIFTYDGWLYASYFSGEIEGGAGEVARSCIKGIVLVVILYVLLNVALVNSAGLAAIAGSDLAIAKALELIVHPAAGAVVVVAAILILLSHQNLEYMAGPRILQSLAEDGFVSEQAKSSGKRGNPVVAVLITWLVTVSLVVVGSFEFLLLVSVFLFVPLYLALIAGVLILRKREPEAERPYRAWAHPYTTWFCMAAWTVITVFQAYVERETAIYALGMVAVSWPVYLYLKSRVT